MKKIICLFVSLFVAGAANAALITFGPTSATGTAPSITFNNVVTPTTITGDATVTLNLMGDFDNDNEYVDVQFDSFSLGRVFDNDISNDIFDFAFDEGNQSASILTGTATISESIFASLIADGFLNLSFDTSLRVNCCGPVKHLSGSIAFTVPEPGSIALLGLGLVGFGFSRKRNIQS